MAEFDPTRLYIALLNTGLQTKDNPLYQVIYQLIGITARQNTIISGGGGGGGTTINHQTTNILGGPILDGIDGLDGIGVPGTKGDTGATGATGPSGSGFPGMDGIDGENGLDGIPGTQGPAGNTGPQGIPGMGNPGIDGLDGSDGLDAIPGPVGLTGATGSQGIQGNQGIPGFDGIDPDYALDAIPGNQGVTGPTGSQGIQGNQGIPGVDGIDGNDSLDAIPGNIGLTGPTGTTGSQGPIGIPGLDGLDADYPLDAIPGPQGIAGTNGTSGTSGTNGPPGMDGDSIENGDIFVIQQLSGGTADNSQEPRVISTDKTIPAGISEVTVGPVTINAGVTVTFTDSESRWQILGGSFNPIPVYVESKNKNPTGQAQSTRVMMGLGIFNSIIPINTGTILVIAYGSIASDSASGRTEVSLYCSAVGNQSPPLNGAFAALFTQVGSAVDYTTATGNYPVPFSMSAIVSNLTIGKSYWLDIALSSPGSTGLASVTNVSIIGLEL